MRIVYMGTPEFAVAGLKALQETNHEIVGVITAPDKPAGRGRKIQMSAVKEYAISQDYNILQPTNLKSEDFIAELKELQADLFIVVAFRMLPEVVWAMPPKGTFNLHASLLPQYRGAAPINWAVINGEKETGVTTFFLQHKIDTGDILLQEKVTIDEKDTAGTLHDKLMYIGAEVIIKTIDQISSNNINPTPQQMNGDLKEAPKIFRDDCEIDWNQPMNDVYNFIRGMSPYPTAHTHITKENDKKKLKLITCTKETYHKLAQSPGTINVEDHKFKIATLDGWIIPEIIQLEGKKRMEVNAFLNGFDLSGYNC